VFEVAFPFLFFILPPTFEWDAVYAILCFLCLMLLFCFVCAPRSLVPDGNAVVLRMFFFSTNFLLMSQSSSVVLFLAVVSGLVYSGLDPKRLH